MQCQELLRHLPLREGKVPRDPGRGGESLLGLPQSRSSFLRADRAMFPHPHPAGASCPVGFSSARGSCAKTLWDVTAAAQGGFSSTEVGVQLLPQARALSPFLKIIPAKSHSSFLPKENRATHTLEPSSKSHSTPPNKMPKLLPPSCTPKLQTLTRRLDDPFTKSDHSTSPAALVLKGKAGKTLLH